VFNRALKSVILARRILGVQPALWLVLGVVSFLGVQRLRPLDPVGRVLPAPDAIRARLGFCSVPRTRGLLSPESAGGRAGSDLD
jgi:hypothetical protein